MKKIMIGLALFAGLLGLKAQDNNSTLVTIGTEQVTAQDFLKAYGKNNNLKKATEADLREYLELYINFKMKVREGELMQLDTSRKFKMELKQYQNQSSQQFLVDKEVTKELEEEAISRAKVNVRASHILINCSEAAQPKDTAAAYARILSIRNDILNGKISFADAATQYSDDPSARDMVNPQNGRKHTGNKGDLGYFTVFDLIYDFESAAYKTPVGQISMPIRTKFGYHIIYVQDRIDAIQEINIAQIYISDSLAKEGKMLPATKQKLDAALKALKGGMDFEEAAIQYSEDENVGISKGVQEPFAPSRRQGDFVRSILNLKEGEYSEPIASQNGWHIIKLINLMPVVIDDDIEYQLKSKLNRDSRAYKSKDSFIAKLKKEYNYTEPGRKSAFKLFLKNMPPEFFQTKDADLSQVKGIEKLKPMATFADVTISAAEYAKYLTRFRGVRVTPDQFENFLQERFNIFAQEKIMKYENEHLMEKYPELKELVQEFHDGMVLFEINTNKVWAAAVQDSLGLEEYYNSHLSQYVDETTQAPRPLGDIRAIVITDFQEYLDKQWILELRKKYNPVINEETFSKLLK